MDLSFPKSHWRGQGNLKMKTSVTELEYRQVCQQSLNGISEICRIGSDCKERLPIQESQPLTQAKEGPLMSNEPVSSTNPVGTQVELITTIGTSTRTLSSSLFGSPFLSSNCYYHLFICLFDKYLLSNLFWDGPCSKQWQYSDKQGQQSSGPHGAHILLGRRAIKIPENTI